MLLCFFNLAHTKEHTNQPVGKYIKLILYRIKKSSKSLTYPIPK